MENKLIEVNGIKGYKKAPFWLKKKYFEATNYTCQDCHQKERFDDKLQPHRIKQGNKDGLYTIVPLNHPNNNIKVLHKSCHKKYHYNNYSWCKSK